MLPRIVKKKIININLSMPFYHLILPVDVRDYSLCMVKCI